TPPGCGSAARSSRRAASTSRAASACTASRSTSTPRPRHGARSGRAASTWRRSRWPAPAARRSASRRSPQSSARASPGLCHKIGAMSRPSRITVLFNTDYDAEACATDVISVETSARAVATALTESGFEGELICLHGLEVLAVIDQVRAAAPALVFNLCESMAGNPCTEPTFVGLLDLFGIPYTGADLLALASCLHKQRAK